MIMMARPLSFYKFGYSVVAESFFVGYSNVLALTTDLLITFYWQEILVQYNQQSSNKILNNLGKNHISTKKITFTEKFRIPFVITAIIMWTVDTVSNLSRVHIIRSFENALFFTTVATIVFLGCIVLFFLYTGRKILLRIKNLAGSFGKKQVSKVTRLIYFNFKILADEIHYCNWNVANMPNYSFYIKYNTFYTN